MPRIVNNRNVVKAMPEFRSNGGLTTVPVFRAAAPMMGLAIFLVLAGCSKDSAPPPRSIPEVSVIEAQPEPVRLTTELPARTAPRRVAEIRPQVSGIIQKRLFEEGDEVEAGQVLYQIDPAPFEAALRNAEAALARAEAVLPALVAREERFAGLLADNAVSRQDYDDAVAARSQTEAEMQGARAAIETARINLEYTQVTAPISGRTGISRVTDGALVSAYQPVALTTIQQIDPMYVDVPQSTTELLRLRRMLNSGRLRREKEDQVDLRLVLSDGTAYPHEGTLQFQDISVEPSTETVILRGLFPNPDRVLLPGMFVRAVIPEGVSIDAFLIPQQAVFRNPRGDPYVFLVDEKDTIRQRKIGIDRAIGNRWLVSSGIESGDRILIEGSQKARPGDSVTAVPFEGSLEDETPAERNGDSVAEGA